MYLSILWHLHQPIYRSPQTGEYVLPWVNFHLTKNYSQMALLAEEAGFPCSFNLVPCLLEQISDYASGRARDTLQDALEADPKRLTPGQVGRLRKLWPGGTAAKTRQELQLHALASLFSPLLDTRKDKEGLLDLQKKTWAQVIPHYKKLWTARQVELTTSAYYHPLLPLVFDIRAGGQTYMPSLPFAHPEDGKAQIKKGREYFKQTFGASAAGIWPSEGGISLEVARAMAEQGYSFAVTDENILWKSLGVAPAARLLYQPYACQSLTVFFRDRELSDLLSFEYWRWPEKDAVSHLLAKLEEKGRGCPESSICVLALDGENPWAGYKENGVPFLREFYGRIKKAEAVTPTFLGDYLAFAKPGQGVDLIAGTWLGSFSKWVGSPAKNAAWDRLSRVREQCEPGEEIYIAEGSDWFWWFGEE
ncbi:MAG: glycoside hydrolase family 57 protein, partial [Acidobacteriota bacterium]